MAKSNVFLNPTYRDHTSYRDFPMRQVKVFSSTIGHILPIYFDYLHVGDKVDCGCRIKTRLQPMVAPSFMHLQTHVDWFFVPLKQIYRPILDLLYGIQDFDSDFFSTSGSATLPLFQSQIDAFYDEIVNTDGKITADNAVILRCLDFLGCPLSNFMFTSSYDSNTQTLSFANSPALPVWFAAAYQKIWSDHYRVSDWQENNASLYNFDSWQAGTAITNARFKDCFTLHRIPFKRDFNTFVFPSPVFGSGSYNAFGNPMDNINQWLTSLVGTITISPNGNTSTNAASEISLTKSGSVSPASTVIRSDLNSANVKTLFSAEKWLEATRRSPKHYDKQVLSHYGVQVPTGLDGESFFLGGQTSDIVPTDVFATAQTDYTDSQGNIKTTPLGQMAGKAYGVMSDGGCRFEAKTEGVLMAVYYVQPDIIYKQNGFDPLNRLVRVQDFFNEAFDDLGPQPAFNLYRCLIDFENDGNYQPTSFGSWQWRYSELKAKQNLAIGNVCGDMKMWALSRFAPEMDTWDDFVVPSSLLNGIMVVDYADEVPMSYYNTFIADISGSRNYVDALGAYEALTNGIYSRDPFINESLFYVNKVSKMSTYGLQNL